MLFPKKTKKPSVANRKKTGQKKMFAEVWSERTHICYVCKKYIQNPLSYVFAHGLSKGVHPEYKFDKRNIFLVCSLDCHHSLDSLFAHKSIGYILSLNEILSPRSTHTDSIEK